MLTIANVIEKQLPHLTIAYRLFWRKNQTLVMSKAAELIVE